MLRQSEGGCLGKDEKMGETSGQDQVTFENGFQMHEERRGGQEAVG